MVTVMKRPSFLTGLTIFILGAWSIVRLDTFRVGYSRVLMRTGHGHGKDELSITHTVIRSATTPDGTYFLIDLMGESAMNPNIIPHPVLRDTWVLVAQLRQESQHFAELVCNASFDENVLKCINTPSKLPIAPTVGDKCEGDLAYIGLNQGPHDARVFHGPKQPYTVYGSNSGHTCFGQWIHDFRNLVEWRDETDTFTGEFSLATELQRPPPWSAIEKNWFLFWDVDGNTYAHFDLLPNRVFAKVEASGAVGENLASLTQDYDDACMQRYMPKLGPELESVHQATNSLSITMCKRNDMWCTPNVSNTFVFTIFQHKTYFNFHAVYEPYVLVFEQTPPFKIRAISKKPLWVNGRRKVRTSNLSEAGSRGSTSEFARDPGEDNEEMIYITSMSWKDQGQNYHGYIDDVLFIAFGIEDELTAAIDVLAGDLMQDLDSC